jgi:hypothetical protein
VTAIGLGSRLASVRTMAPSGAQIAANPEAALDQLAASCRLAVHEDGAAAVILGGLGLAGLAEAIANDVPGPLIDNMLAAVRAAEAAAGLGAREASPGRLRCPRRSKRPAWPHASRPCWRGANTAMAPRQGVGRARLANQAPTGVLQAGAGCALIQWRAMSSRRVTHTRSWRSR